MNEKVLRIISENQTTHPNGRPLYIEFKNAALPIRSMGQTGLDLLRDAIGSYLRYALGAIRYDENQWAAVCVRDAEYYYHTCKEKEQEKIMELLRGMLFDKVQQLPVESARKNSLAAEIYSNIHDIIITGTQRYNTCEG